MGALAVVIVADLLTQRRSLKSSTDLLNGITLVGLFGALVTSWQALGTVEAQSLFASMLADDGLLGVFRPIFCLTSIVVLLLSMRSKELEGVRLGEMLALLLTVTAALMWMAGSVNLVMIYLSLETVSVASYIMVGYLSSDRLSNEASLKYILFGAVSTGAMLFGLSLLYGMTGTLDLYGVRAALAEGAFGPGLLFVLILIAAGIGFKIAAAPFHFWCPDVYTGAPTPVTAFLSVGPKAAGFAILIRFFYLGLAEPAGGGAIAPVGGADWQMLLMMLAVITMTLGNVAALLQTNVKRLLAYSSIAHAGTMLMAACVLSVDGVQAIAAYLAGYLFTNLGGFALVIRAHPVTG
ncbi:MAG: proton-conducting transporter membrane subunit, partial [Gammaproteobacteria bacterium]|nr:proton-conducting transporter membrane subunit [Gammaproteobacteria bacterium]